MTTTLLFYQVTWENSPRYGFADDPVLCRTLDTMIDGLLIPHHILGGILVSW